MRRLFGSLLAVALAAALGWIAVTALAPGSWVARWAPCPRNWAWAPAWLPRASPLDSQQIRFSGGHAKLCYGRPSLRGRDMLGGEAVPYGRLWRTGANEPTTLHFDLPVELGGIYLEPGSYSLYSVPGERSWELVINRSTRQWGLENLYDDEVARHEVGRFRVPAESLAQPVETLTIRPVPGGGDRWTLQLEWQRTRLRIPLAAAVPAFLGEEELQPFEDGD